MNAAVASATADPALALEVQYAAGIDGLPAQADFQRWAQAALAVAGRGGAAELAIRIVDGEEGRELNRRYRGIDRPTNVLSFPFQAPPGVPVQHLGDLVICAPVVQREAHEQGKPEAAHWAHMTVHGVLHLLGHDHQDDAQAQEMETMEKRILATLGYGDPYA